MEKPEVISLYGFFKKFPDEEAARVYFESRRWVNGRYCPHCSSVDTVEVKNHKPMPYRCKDCRSHFSVRTDSVLEESRLPLQKWLMAMYMMTTARKGIPSTQMARELGITQKSAWFLAQRIREGFFAKMAGANGNGGGSLEGEVEADETYIGGKEMNKHASKKLHAGRGTVGKTIVAGIKQRNGRVVATIVPNTSAKTLQRFIAINVLPGTTVYTDEHSSYVGMAPYTHRTVHHSAKQYVDGMAHTNSIESFWALLKRGHYGIFHYMSVKHLHRYVNEFSFRHNTAKVGTMKFIDETVSNMGRRRLTYKELINA
jgi:transposase-like protein